MFPTRRRSVLSNFTLREKREMKRIRKLSDLEVLQELEDLMQGRNYSWLNISRGLQSQLDRQTIEIEHFESGNIPYEWNVLCDEKISWEYCCRPSFKSYKFNRACLVNLKIIPTQALGLKGRKFATQNVDINAVIETVAVDSPEVLKQSNIRPEYKADYEKSPGYFYTEGPEFRIEYIHDHVEE